MTARARATRRRDEGRRQSAISPAAIADTIEARWPNEASPRVITTSANQNQRRSGGGSVDSSAPSAAATKAIANTGLPSVEPEYSS